jgi:hypothetical protein
MKIVRPIIASLALVVLAGCTALNSNRAKPASLVTVEVKVEAFDPDGAVFDLVSNSRVFDPGTITRGPLALVSVTQPGLLAGRKYTILLPEFPDPAARKMSDVLREHGASVVLQMPASFVRLGPHEIMDFADLRAPAPPAAPSSPNRAGSL